MAKELSYILARAKARLADQPIPHDPRIIQHLAPPKMPDGPLPMASILARDMFVPKTEWEWAQENNLPPARINGKGVDLRKPLIFKGEVGEIQYLSKLTPEQLDLRAQAKAREDAPYKGTAQERSALGQIRVKQARGARLTKAEQHLLYKFNRARIIARFKPKG